MQWLMLQQDEPEDYVIATGIQTSVREFINLCAQELNWGGILWQGKGSEEIGKRKDIKMIFSNLENIISMRMLFNIIFC